MNETAADKTLGKRLRALRRHAQLTQAKLAEQAEISCVYVNKLERGLAMPSLQVLQRLAQCLNTDAASLLSCEAHPLPEGTKPKASPYMSLYLTSLKRKKRHLVFHSSEIAIPALPSSQDETQS